MKTLAIVLVAACGPIYPQSQQATPTPTSPSSTSSSGPPGGQMDPPSSAPPSDPYAPSSDPSPTSDPYARTDEPARTDPRRDAPPRDEPPATDLSTPKPAPKSNASRLSPEAEAFITEHNRYRAQHCAKPLTWSPQLAADAQKWADTLKSKGCVFGHSGGKHGENLAAGTTGALPPEEVVRMWYDEVKIYSFSKPTGFSMETGHFTQVVWTDTTQVGCGMAQCKGNDIWVCQYESPGNWEGQFRQKVLPSSCKK